LFTDGFNWHRVGNWLMTGVDPCTYEGITCKYVTKSLQILYSDLSYHQALMASCLRYDCRQTT
jgi:hypothetical protein